MIDNHLTVLEAADALGISPQRVKQLIYAGRLPAFRFGRQWVISQSALDLVRVRPKAGRPKTK